MFAGEDICVERVDQPGSWGALAGESIQREASLPSTTFLARRLSGVCNVPCGHPSVSADNTFKCVCVAILRTLSCILLS